MLAVSFTVKVTVPATVCGVSRSNIAHSWRAHRIITYKKNIRFALLTDTHRTTDRFYSSWLIPTATAKVKYAHLRFTMHYINTTTTIVSSLLMASVFASTPTSFEVPGAAPGTAAAPEVDTTTVFITSTYRLTSAVTISATVNSTTEASKTSQSLPSTESMAIPGVSYTTAGPTYVPVTLWDGNSSRIVFPQNSTTIEVSTGSPANSTSTVIVTTTVPLGTLSTATYKDKTASGTVSASVSVEPSNNAGKMAGNALICMGAVAVLVAFL